MKKKLIAIAAIGILTAMIWILSPSRTITIHVADKESERAEKIDLYFKERNMPLAGYGQQFIREAKANGLEWNLLPAIAIRESSGGKEACGGNVFGWASCKKTFKDYEEAIKVVAKHLGGNVSSTASFYRDKTTKEKLLAYNPPSIVPLYADEVIEIMKRIENN
jgi:hypothetical protein